MALRENDILFFHLHRRYLDMHPQYGFQGIFVLASFLNHNGYIAQSFAGTLEAGKRILDEALREGKVSVIGLYCDYENITENIFLSHYVKSNWHLPVIIGGPQATALKEDFFQRSLCDAVVRYEGELTVLDLMNYFLEGIGELPLILGISYYRDGIVKHNEDRPLIENLDALPFPDEDCYLSSYKTSPTIMTGRGCPFHCSFCHEGNHTRKVRMRSVENVLQEVDVRLHECEDMEPYILFTDDTFTLMPERVRELCDGLRKRQEQRSFRWFCEGHVHTIYQHPEMIEYMKKAGCCRIQLGIEAGTQEVLDAYRKGTTLDEIREVIRICRDGGIQQVYGNIILAGAFFNRDVYESNKAFAKEILSLGQGCVELGVVTFWPLKETSMTSHPEDYGLRIIDSEFFTSIGDFPQVETDMLNRWEIVSMQRELDEELERYMTSMLMNREVPLERILSWFPMEGICSGTMTRWHRCLISNELLYHYYNMLFSREVYRSEDVEGDLMDAHPMRVVRLYKYLRNIDDQNAEIFGCFLHGIERDILILATGKLSVKEILVYLKRHDEENVTCKQVFEVLQRLEKNHLIVYSKY